MRSRKLIVGLLSVLLAGIALLSVITRRDMTPIPDGAVLVTKNGNATILVLAEQELTPIRGQLVNGSGKTVRFEGIGLCLESLADETVKTVKVVSADNYSAELSEEELYRAYLITENGVRLIVIGDRDRKRDVKNVISIELH